MTPTRLCLVALAMLAIDARGALAAEGTLQGAWADPSMECKDVFVRSGDLVTFRRPPDLFANAFIVSAGRLTTPGATCRIESTTASSNGRQRLSLSCATSVAVDAASVELASMPDGSLQRYTGSTDTIGSRYIRCFP
jgi:hypothetical protein